MLSEFRCGSSCASSTSNPGARRTRVAERNPPSRTVATSVSACRVILRASMPRASVVCLGMVGMLLAHRGPARTGVWLARGDCGVMNLLHGIHAAVGFGEQALYIESVFRAECCSNAECDQFAAADLASRLDSRLIEALRLFPR